SGAVLLKSVSKDYATDLDPSSNKLSNPRVIRETTTLSDTNQVRKTETDYETFQYNYSGGGTDNAGRSNITEVREYDWGSGTPGALLKRTDFTYLHNQNAAYTQRNIVDRVSDVRVYDSAGTTKSWTYSLYDQYPSGIQASGAVQHD